MPACISATTTAPTCRVCRQQRQVQHAAAKSRGRRAGQVLQPGSRQQRRRRRPPRPTSARRHVRRSTRCTTPMPPRSLAHDPAVLGQAGGTSRALQAGPPLADWKVRSGGGGRGVPCQLRTRAPLYSPLMCCLGLAGNAGDQGARAARGRGRSGRQGANKAGPFWC